MLRKDNVLLNNGNTAPARDLKNVLAAMAEAALEEVSNQKTPISSGYRNIQHEVSVD